MSPSHSSLQDKHSTPTHIVNKKKRTCHVCPDHKAAAWILHRSGMSYARIAHILSTHRLTARRWYLEFNAGPAAERYIVSHTIGNNMKGIFYGDPSNIERYNGSGDYEKETNEIQLD